MSGNISEADQLIIQLLTALNSTVSSYAASQESDKEDATANQLSLTALVVSLAALIVTLLQAILEYVSSNSAQGEKCNTGAIGEYARFSGSRRWSWRHWRRQYFYREFDLDLIKVGESLHDVDRSEVGSVFNGLQNLHPRSPGNFEKIGFSWRYDRYLENSDKLPKNTIRNGIHHLFRRVEAGWVLALPQSLPMKYRLKWFYYLIFRRHREQSTPRATWAQLLTLLNVDSRKIHTSRLVGADCIPSTLDVPVQKVKLADLGVFAFCLGFNKVELSTEDRTISAAGPLGTITTESLPGYGAVVRFQILSPRLRHFVAVHDRPVSDFLYHRNQVLGAFIFPDMSISTRILPGLLPMQYDWLRSRLDFHGTALRAGCPTVADEATQWLKVENEVPVSGVRETDLLSRRLAAWQAGQNDKLAGGTRRWPTILLAASVACLPGTSMGFPSAALLCPFLHVFQHMASLLSPDSATWDILDDLEESGTTLFHLLRGNFWRIVGHGDLIRGDGNFSWTFNKFDPIDLEQVEKILLGRMLVPSWLRSRLRKKSRSVADAGSHAISLLEGRLLPQIVELLTSFDPLSWAKAVRSYGRPERVPPWLIGLEAAALDEEASSILWTQTFLLDIAICKAIYQYVGLGPDTLNAAKKALVDCWEDPLAEAPLQDLDKFLFQKLFSNKGTEESTEKMRVLANMIKMRTLCYIAYMMVIPDSTSLYEASLKDPVMLPMI